MIEASTTRRPSTPLTRNLSSTTQSGLASHPAGADRMKEGGRSLGDEIANVLRALGGISGKELSGAPLIESRRMAEHTSLLDGEREAAEIFAIGEGPGVDLQAGALGSADTSRTLPRLLGRIRAATKEYASSGTGPVASVANFLCVTHMIRKSGTSEPSVEP